MTSKARKWWQDRNAFEKVGLSFLGVCAVAALGAKVHLTAKGVVPWVTQGDVAFLLLILGNVCFRVAPGEIRHDPRPDFPGLSPGSFQRERLSWPRLVTELFGWLLLGMWVWLAFIR
ncbi:MAG: hypothetical protein JO299_05760 [Gammaproteobacteria bacterium]|nr:hypothetical protein [Gammaproteobacteria bacterium]